MSLVQLAVERVVVSDGTDSDEKLVRKAFDIVAKATNDSNVMGDDKKLLLMTEFEFCISANTFSLPRGYISLLILSRQYFNYHLFRIVFNK